jgi:hypothetical protein
VLLPVLLTVLLPVLLPVLLTVLVLVATPASGRIPLPRPMRALRALPGRRVAIRAGRRRRGST